MLQGVYQRGLSCSCELNLRDYHHYTIPLALDFFSQSRLFLLT